MHHTVAESFNELQGLERTALAKQLCDIHTIIDFTLRTQVLPEYIKSHTTGGEQTLHWESIAPGSSTQLKRKLTLERMQGMQANTRVPGAQGQLLDYYNWRLDPDDSGMLHLLHRDLPDAASTKKRDCIDDGEEADEEDAVFQEQLDQGRPEALQAPTCEPCTLQSLCLAVKHIHAVSCAHSPVQSAACW
jgi:hypothetical protein